MCVCVCVRARIGKERAVGGSVGGEGATITCIWSTRRSESPRGNLLMCLLPWTFSLSRSVGKRLHFYGHARLQKFTVNKPLMIITVYFTCILIYYTLKLQFKDTVLTYIIRLEGSGRCILNYQCYSGLATSSTVFFIFLQPQNEFSSYSRRGVQVQTVQVTQKESWLTKVFVSKRKSKSTNLDQMPKESLTILMRQLETWRKWQHLVATLLNLYPHTFECSREWGCPQWTPTPGIKASAPHVLTQHVCPGKMSNR